MGSNMNLGILTGINVKVKLKTDMDLNKKAKGTSKKNILNIRSQTA